MQPRPKPPSRGLHSLREPTRSDRDLRRSSPPPHRLYAEEHRLRCRCDRRLGSREATLRSADHRRYSRKRLDGSESAPPLPTALTRNPIYRVGKLPSAKCAEPAYEPTSLANARAYFTQYVACLNKAWAPAIRKAGFTFRPPKLVVVLGQSPSSPCTVDDGRDYYCGGTIYMDAETHLALQASCYSGVYIGADRNYFPVSSEWLDVWGLVIRNTIDDAHDHGKGENHEYWTTAGFDAASPAACNTYTVASSLVG